MRILKLFSVASLFIVSSQGFSAGYGTAGCGLGSIVFGSKPGPIQILAATTNGTFGNQTFGITSGTSNCGGGGSKSASVIEQENFITSNMATLEKEIVQGGGESVAALSYSLGCEESQLGNFSATMQASHGQLFQQKDASAILSKVKNSVRANAVLAKSCAAI